ncbi:AAA family ATPase, partial [Shinella sp.]|uniref:ATP-binding protein n=1 Tax=Shinella sp. TaxID=1870904 RepID=UPI003F7311B0
MKELIDEVADDGVLSQSVIVVPHFGNEDAHKSLNGYGFAARAKSLDCDAVYIECPYSDLHPTTLQKIRGEIADWGTRRRAILATGDNRHASWNRLGAHECWVRLGEVTLEGFRQAFLADEARIAYAEPETPSERIVEIEILSSLTGPDPLRISFNESFSALIGGRGSGKSSILEYLRFGLGKSETDLFHDAGGKRPREREARLIEDTLSEGYVKLKLQRGGVSETWVRKGEKPDEIVVTQDGADSHILTIDAAQKRFPARAFHQKELSTTMVDGAAAADNITGIAAAEIIEERRRNERDIAAAKREVSVTLQQLSAHWQAELQLTEARNATEDVRRRRRAVSEGLQKGGVSEGDLKVLADASRYGRAENYLDEVLRRLEADATRIKAAGENLLAIDATRFA